MQQQLAACGGLSAYTSWLMLAPEAVAAIGFLVGWVVVRLCLRVTAAAPGAESGSTAKAKDEDEAHRQLQFLREVLSKSNDVPDIKIEDRHLTCDVQET